jgi:hypothetical protein
MANDNLRQRRHVLFTMLTACAWRDSPPRPSSPASARSSAAGSASARIVVGMARGWGKAVEPLDMPEGAMVSVSVIQAAAARFTASVLGPDPAREVTPRDAIYELLSSPPPAADEHDG